MTFLRNPATTWNRTVPGARWYKADLHIHTIDDFPGKRAKPPVGMPLPDTPERLREYARRVLQASIANGVQVLALTPHSPRLPSLAGSSAVWAIVDEWNGGHDDDDVPFREKIYAVFPGFEPSLQQGSRGLHLLFVFDPEIGRQKYLQVFDLIMGRGEVWSGSTLNISMQNATGAFDALRDFRNADMPRDSTQPAWQYLVLAPHVESAKGLLSAQKAQVLEHFSHDDIAALELGDNTLPEDIIKKKNWLADAMARHRQAFFHSTDAYTIGEIGNRYTWLKLASPRVEALRQAFVSSDSRIRIAFDRGVDGLLREAPESPDVTTSGRPWLKSVTVEGGASFFGRTANAEPAVTRFDLSPDLTCVIGGSMTGKSTFLDGLRSYVKAQMPQNAAISKQVRSRGEMVFLGGSAAVSLDLIGTDPSESFPERWPALFFAQNELQRLSEDPEAVEDILSRLQPTETEGIKEREGRMIALDQELSALAEQLSETYTNIEELEQDCAMCLTAADDLAEFKAAGVESLNRVAEDLQRWRTWKRMGESLRSSVATVADIPATMVVPSLDLEAYPREAERIRQATADLTTGLDGVRNQLRTVAEDTVAWTRGVDSMVGLLKDVRDRMQEQIELRLARQGTNAAKIQEFDALSRRAARHPTYVEQLRHTKGELKEQEGRFGRLLADRRACRDLQRRAYDRIARKIRDDFEGQFAVDRVEDGDTRRLSDFLSSLKERGVTRWWKTVPKPGPSPEDLLNHLRSETLSDVGMSSVVGTTFQNRMTRRMRRTLAAIRCPDRYELAMQLDDGPRRLDQLSGGRRVSLILSLLLATNDERALVIDQPEDELDNRFLFDAVLPALKRLKGRRQIIVATHSANIVVNGDADQVILLEATASRGRVAQSGAIEDTGVRDGIVQTVDGGDQAFQLRYRKYGF